MLRLAPRASAPLSHEEYRAQRHLPALDGLRAVSVLLVATVHVGYPHVWPAFHGETGVSIFFLLSGYLITTLSLREEQDRGSLRLGQFYLRRLFRIYPLYLGVLALYCVLILVAGMQADRAGLFRDNLPYFLFGLPEHALFFHSGTTAVPFDGAWSLGIEEKFYLVWPLVGFVLLAGRLRLRIVVLGGVVLTGVACGLAGGSLGGALAPYAHIALGCILALLLHDPRSYEVLRVLGRPPVLFGSVVLLLALQFGTSEVMRGGVLYVLYGVPGALVLGGTVIGRARWLTVLRSRPLVALGRISYAFYLVHNFGLNAAESLVPRSWGFAGSIVSTFLGLSLAIAASAVLHRLLERPLIRVGQRLAKRSVRPVADAPVESQIPVPRTHTHGVRAERVNEEVAS